MAMALSGACVPGARADSLRVTLSAERQAREREQDLRRRLRLSTFKCTCRLPLHSDKCMLYPTFMGERRWPGKDLDVTPADLEWLHDQELQRFRQLKRG